MGYITTRKQGRNSYYIYQESYREKINPKDSGMRRGSGRSKVCTRSIYLGSAEKVLQRVQEKSRPTELKIRQFGLIAAAYQTAQRIGLLDILRRKISGIRYGTPRWIYFLVTVINRLDSATSKNKMEKWLNNTILPELLRLDTEKFTSKNFWYVTDDIISERKLAELRAKEEIQEDDVFVGIDDSTFTMIESELFKRIDELIGISPSIICYDTTNFYTYIEEPKRSELANSCHSKDYKHHLRHIGLFMAVDKVHGIPLLNQIYRANCHDSKLFSFILSGLIISLRKLCGPDADLVLVVDKGNNKKETFKYLSGKISWVGSLVPSHYEDLMALDISEYHGTWNGIKYYRCKRTVMDIECVIVLTFNFITKRKKEYSLEKGVKKLEEEIRSKWENYKKTPKTITKGINSIKEKSGYGKCIKISISNGNIYFEENKVELEKIGKNFGKNIIFSDMEKAETGYLIDTYAEKNIIEDDFHLLKDVTIIRFRPIRHWTDTKIRAYAFCCVIAMTLIRVMQWLVEQEGYKMSPNVIKEELSDLQEVVMVYSATEAERKISQRSTMQNKLWDIFQLGKIERQLSLH